MKDNKLLIEAIKECVENNPEFSDRSFNLYSYVVEGIDKYFTTLPLESRTIKSVVKNCKVGDKKIKDFITPKDCKLIAKSIINYYQSI